MSTPSQQLLKIALQVLEFRCGLTSEEPTVEDLDFFWSQGPEELDAQLPIDELACRVVHRELERERIRQREILKTA